MNNVRLNAENQTNPEKCLCADGRTWRGGDKRMSMFWNIKNEEQADAIIAMMKCFTVSQCEAMFRKGLK